ncbi:hypothetical protein P168DRAFT_324599 [Aspergillus campestris IBT 28561]|uniref:TNT domain-containing protein n=1 Tax=Aspergillus campestris (strain IBT 28561) TaxID=1392248 RepID=A0A2I1DBC2_ASPC2|nr:uncharacterized protein P168DRAFT_324599 [Aspergillus campestris IBT 28561]PKY07161.1 hypothetical protein P168DRAFT_324599 [Aspergillus campestris IBT 28561]
MHFLPSLLVLAVSAAALPQAVQDRNEPPIPTHCHPDPCAGITFQNASFICGDSRLGPIHPPKKFPLRNELRTYAPLGDLCPAEFLKKWATSVDPAGTYIYPPSNGYVVADSDNKPILGNVTLPVGQKLDRFGSEFGSFLAPLGAPYIERSLPPSNLVSRDGDYPFNYHVYQVTKGFVVGLGPIAPWFEQPGMGTQFLAYSNVKTLVEGGFLRRLTPEEFDERVEFSNGYTPGPVGGS